MYGPGRIVVFFCLLASLLLFALFRMIRGPAVLQVVIAVFVFSAIGAAAFLLGRSHAKDRHDRKPGEPGPH